MTIFVLNLIMTRLIFYILAFGFMIQCIGLDIYVAGSADKIELYADSNQTGEENNKDEANKNEDQMGTGFLNELSSVSKVIIWPGNWQDYPQGFYGKPFLPPRYGTWYIVASISA